MLNSTYNRIDKNNMFVAFVLSTLLLVLWTYFLWARRRYYVVAWQLRGPIGLPFIGVGLQMMNPETFLQFMERISQKYTCPFISWMGTNCFLYVNDPETVETVFNSTHCTNKGDFYHFMSSAIGDGLFTSSSPRWNKHRRLINPAFSRQLINNFLPIFNAEGNVLIQKLTGETHKELEIYQILKKIVLEAACQTTMGKKMNFQHDGSMAIFEAYNGITEVCVKRMLSPWLYSETIYRRSSLFVRQQKVVNVLFGFVEQLLQQTNHIEGSGTNSGRGVNEYKQSQSSSSSSSSSSTSSSVVSSVQSTGVRFDNSKTFVDTGFHPTKQQNHRAQQEALASDEQHGSCRKSKSIFIEQVRGHIERGQLSWQDVRDEANVIIAATFETTSTALYFTILCLAMHPEYQDKLHNELFELFSQKASNRGEAGVDIDGAASVTNEQLERMTYTEMVINEAMRLFAPVPMVLRRAEQDLLLTGKRAVLVPRGTQIGIDIYNMQRRVDVWGPLASTYNPDAHFGPQAPPRHAFAFVPFTKGLRMCIGYRYALILMKVLLAKIFLNFRISTTASLEQLAVKGTISLKLREYPLCKVERR